jgi:hypothetical protein
MEASGRKPSKVWSDAGKEFYNKIWKPELDAHKIVLYSSYTSEHKASMIERFNKTLKTMMWKVFTARGNHKWIDILPALMEVYNERKHSALKMSPLKASALDVAGQKTLWEHQYGGIAVPRRVKPKYPIGSLVRIFRAKGTFEKGYTPNWTDELYRIVSVSPTFPALYYLEDLQHEPVLGGFYEADLLPTKEDFKHYEKRITSLAEAPDVVPVKLLSWSLDPKKRGKFTKYNFNVLFSDGVATEQNLGLLVGDIVVDANGNNVFKANDRNPSSILAPYGDWIMADAELRKDPNLRRISSE